MTPRSSRWGPASDIPFQISFCRMASSRVRMAVASRVRVEPRRVAGRRVAVGPRVLQGVEIGQAHPVALLVGRRDRVVQRTDPRGQVLDQCQPGGHHPPAR